METAGTQRSHAPLHSGYFARSAALIPLIIVIIVKATAIPIAQIHFR
jgi:hypothetical protein